MGLVRVRVQVRRVGLVRVQVRRVQVAEREGAPATGSGTGGEGGARGVAGARGCGGIREQTARRTEAGGGRRRQILDRARAGRRVRWANVPRHGHDCCRRGWSGGWDWDSSPFRGRGRCAWRDMD